MYQNAVGRSSWTTNAAITEDATFWLASLTKLPVSIAVLQCVERGQITLDEDVSTVLPELKDLQLIKPTSPLPDVKTAPLPEDSLLFELLPRKKPINLRHLLTHSSGLIYDALSPVVMAWRASRGEESRTAEGRIPESFSQPLIFEPGEDWAYGPGLDWAGLAVERLNGGIKLEEYLHENIFGPLGGGAFTFSLVEQSEIKNSLVDVSNRTADGGLEPGSLPLPEVLRDNLGGSGGYGSAVAFSKVLKDVISTKPKLLGPEYIDALFKPQLAPGSPAIKSMKAFEFMAGIPVTAQSEINHALGGIIATGEGSILPRGSLTWFGLPNVLWFANRVHGVAGIVTTQIFPTGDSKYASLRDAFVREAFRLRAKAE